LSRSAQRLGENLIKPPTQLSSGQLDRNCTTVSSQYGVVKKTNTIRAVPRVGSLGKKAGIGIAQ